MEEQNLEEAFRGFYDRYARYVRACCLSRLRSVHDVEDLESLVWMDVYRQFSRFSDGDPRKLLHQLIRWRTIDLLRSRHPQALTLMDNEQLLDLLASKASRPETADLRLVLKEALSKESPEDQRILVGRYIEEKSWEELASQLELHRNTVYRRATQSLQRLRSFLATPTLT